MPTLLYSLNFLAPRAIFYFSQRKSLLQVVQPMLQVVQRTLHDLQQKIPLGEKTFTLRGNKKRAIISGLTPYDLLLHRVRNLFPPQPLHPLAYGQHLSHGHDGQGQNVIKRFAFQLFQSKNNLNSVGNGMLHPCLIQDDRKTEGSKMEAR